MKKSKQKMIFNDRFGFILFILLITINFSCGKFVEPPVPDAYLIKASVFSNEATATAALLGIYNQMTTTSFASGDANSITVLAGWSADELDNYTFSQDFQDFYTNSLSATNSIVENDLWTVPYNYIYSANSILEGLEGNKMIDSNAVNQLMGEAKFIRAFCYFYLTNMFGDVPLALTTDYTTNSILARSPVTTVYNQIIDDLTDAQKLLSSDYSFSNGERVRPNKWAAAALLARCYLYKGDWKAAEETSTTVINNTALYSLQSDLNKVFLANSTEAIWQLMPPSNTTVRNTLEGYNFILVDVPSLAALSSSLVTSFEDGDLRRTNWIDSIDVSGSVYYYPFKYKLKYGTNPFQEYSMVLRLAEQYLIRSEARARLNDVPGSQSDLNVIRSRAGLPNTAANDQASLLSAIEHERRAELFTEWGHRWFDLKRTGRVDEVIGQLKPTWKTTAALYPIPQIQLLNDPGMTQAQNPGY